MAHPKKYSRRITVKGNIYRWRLAINDDYPWIQNIAVYGDDLPHSAEIRLTVEMDSITPALIRRVILHGLSLGFDPANPATSRVLSARQAAQIAYVYPPRVLTNDGRKFTWTPEFSGGLHLKIRSAGHPDGQLLVTLGTLGAAQLTDQVAGRFIAAALQAGWQPEMTGADCFWLDPEICRAILAA